MTFELKDTTIRSELVMIELKPTVSLSLSDISFPLKVFTASLSAKLLKVDIQFCIVKHIR